MGLWEKLREYLSDSSLNDDQCFDFKAFLPPRTQNLDCKADMDVFNSGKLRECILSNIVDQNVPLHIGAWKKLVIYLDRQFNDLSDRVFLQVLVHVSKFDIQESRVMYESTNQHMLEKSLCMKRPSFWNSSYYEKILLEYIERASYDDLLEGEKVILAPPEFSEKIKSRLRSPAVMSAFVKLTTEIQQSESFADVGEKWIKDQIDTAKIYTVNDFVPYWLSGAVLLDGLMLNFGFVPGARDTRRFEAAITSLSIHEFSHYLSRKQFENFNLSTPTKGLPSGSSKRTDIAIADSSMEAGRTVELLLFDRIQPNWYTSGLKAAAEFIRRLSMPNYSGHPLFRREEHFEWELEPRTLPSPAFGVDVYYGSYESYGPYGSYGLC